MKCTNCNKEIPESRVKNNATRYCSENCHQEYWRKVNKKKFKPKKCSVCETEFIPVATTNKYCCKKCKYIAELSYKSKKTGSKKCANCGKLFEPYTSLDKFCSSNCRIENQKVKRSFNWSKEKANSITGENNPAYRNGTFVRGRKKIQIGERKFIKNSKEIKQSMIDNVGYIYCQHCNTSNSLRFESHHIIFRSEKPLHEHLHSKDNLIILCIKCHNDFHRVKDKRVKIVRERGLNILFNINS